MYIDFSSVVREAWAEFAPEQPALSIEDISARVSTNHVYKITLSTKKFVIGKLSYFGKFEHFREDHSIINILAKSLKKPYEKVLARSLTKNDEVFTYRYKGKSLDIWVVFYKPVKIYKSLPKILNQEQIKNLGAEVARFHLACHEVTPQLPPSSKTLKSDIDHLLAILATEHGQYEHRGHIDVIKQQCDRFFEETEKLDLDRMVDIPVFVDWNIGNFSLSKTNRIYSRWDYDWFRMSFRVMDFYFFSRVVSEIGDRTIFSYNIDIMQHERFILFLKAYHKVYPLSASEIKMLKEIYRFFILNYVIKDGRYFFHEIYASRLQREAYRNYFPQIDSHFNPEIILKELNL